MAPIVTAIIIVTLFLGGTRGFSPVPGQAWFVFKVFTVIFLLIWIRATWPRLRIDQIMSFAWKGLFGLSLVNLFLVATEVEFLADDGELSTGALWTDGGYKLAGHVGVDRRAIQSSPRKPSGPFTEGTVSPRQHVRGG